jgi:hypothetical protein
MTCAALHQAQPLPALPPGCTGSDSAGKRGSPSEAATVGTSPGRCSSQKEVCRQQGAEVCAQSPGQGKSGTNCPGRSAARQLSATSPLPFSRRNKSFSLVSADSLRHIIAFCTAVRQPRQPRKEHPSKTLMRPSGVHTGRMHAKVVAEDLPGLWALPFVAVLQADRRLAAAVFPAGGVEQYDHRDADRRGLRTAR